MGQIKSFEDLIVWQEAMRLAEEVYALQKKLPREEVFGLGDQIRRAVVGIPSNIAEGFGRDSTKDFVHFLMMARGSLFEVRTQLILAERLKLLSVSDNVLQTLASTGRLLNALIGKLRSRLSSHQSPTTNHQTPPPATDHL